MNVAISITLGDQREREKEKKPNILLGTYHFVSGTHLNVHCGHYIENLATTAQQNNFEYFYYHLLSSLSLSQIEYKCVIFSDVM